METKANIIPLLTNIQYNCVLFNETVTKIITAFVTSLSFIMYTVPLLIPRSDTTHDELGDLVKTNNPEEINIDDDDTDEEETVEGEGGSC